MKKGRPTSGEERDDLVYVGFKADPETIDAIEMLTAAMQRQSGVLLSKSAVIRHYLIEAALQIRPKPTNTPVAKKKT